MGNDEITTQNNTTQQVESFMAKDKTIKGKNEQQICAILPIDDQLTGRAGLSVFAMYLRNIGLFPIIDRLFGTVRKNGKGLAVTEMFVQILSFFMDGTSRHVSWFDHLAYASTMGIEDQNAVMKPVASTFPRTTAPRTGLSHLHVRAWCRQSSRFASGSRQTRFLSS